MSGVMKGVIVFGFVTAYSIGMGALLNAGIAWTDAPILFPLSLVALFLLIGWQVDRREAARKRRERLRAPRDWRVPGAYLNRPSQAFASRSIAPEGSHPGPTLLR